MSTAFSSTYTPTNTPNFTNPPITIVLTVVLLVFFFVGFFSIYFCRCFMEDMLLSWNLRRTPSGNLVNGRPNTTTTNNGLDPSLIKAFPTFPYSSIKDFRQEKYGLECAICLVEFEDDSLLRLLTACYHVFHQDCIDLWLESHMTCPVCRRNLDSSQEEAEKSQEVVENNNETHNNESLIEEFVSIDIKDDGDRDDNDDNREGKDGKEASASMIKTDVEKQKDGKVEKFSRSHSTGHSIARKNKEEEEEEEDRYTLRLPEHIKVKLLKGHNLTASCTTYAEFSSRSTNGGGGFGEVSGYECPKKEDQNNNP